MELRPGYKQTEVGVIPEEWETGCLGEKTKKVGSGITPTGGEKVYKREGRPFLRSQNVGWGALLMEDIAFIDDETHETFKGTEIESEDVFINITGASIGRSAVADARVEKGNVNQHVCIIRTNKDELYPIFLNYFLLSKSGQLQIDSFQAGGNRQGLNFGQIRSFRLPLPPLPEQRAIAGALGDVDALIGALDRLIAKKRDLKQAAMQQLLTGQTRLPGFSREWEVKRLEELLEYEQPTKYLVKDSEYSDENYVPVLTAGKTFVLGYTNEENGIFNNLPAIIFDDFTTANKYVTFPFKAKSSAMKILKPRDATVNLRLVFEAMQLIKFPLGDHKRYWISEYRNLEIKIPKADEQTAIAAVLSDMDAEIAALEARRDKTRALKQGMMQELLTGRTRLL
ncbi:MAG: restriction endonuclease [Syntrophobacteraceae bacterium CG23_combo_of_CG06-09_8_20_14_all_50_8]|nr:MAG: restriction endonuclease [Syntrophobacteraceae bacterium CG23_combo_of_CG06-09_8_20_14_all_50_8]